MKVQLLTAIRERDEARKELQRITSAKQMHSLKDSAMQPNVPLKDAGAEGFTLTHVLLVAVLSMIIGAMST